MKFKKKFKSFFSVTRIKKFKWLPKIRLNSIKFKYLIPVIITILLSISTVGIIGWFNQKSNLTEFMNDMTSRQVKEVIKAIEKEERNTKILKEHIDESLIVNAKSVAKHIENVPEDQLNEELVELAKHIGVAEIHVSNENGKLAWGTVPEFYGYDYSSQEQSKPFIEALNNKKFKMVQDPQDSGMDGTYFQYVVVARQDKPGIIQIGIDPKKRARLIQTFDITTMAESIEFGENGYVTILNTSGNVISEPNEKKYITFMKEQQYYWGDEVLEKGSGSFIFDTGHQEKIISFDTYDDKYIVCAVIPTSEYLGGLKDFIRNIAIAISISLFLAIGLVAIISNRVIIRRIEKVLIAMKKIGEGKLDTELKDKSTDEIGQLVKEFNNMKENIKKMVLNITETSTNINEVSNKLMESSEQVSIAGQEVARSTSEIASGSDNQVKEIHRGMQELDSLISSVEEINKSTEKISSQADNIGQQNKQGIKTVDTLKNKFKNNEMAMTNVNTKINDLSFMSNNIGEITESITTIAKQTNLLSINASIEAARAGQAGLGFAVVAEEIRSLSEDSHKSAENIKNITDKIKEEVEKAVLSMDQSKQIVKEVNMELENTVKVFDVLKESNDMIIKLIENLNRISDKLDENTHTVASSIESIASVAEETAASTHQISSVTQEQAATYEEINQTSKHLREISKELTELIGQFNLNTTLL